jgi:coenzyme Q-binding protein COQ10
VVKHSETRIVPYSVDLMYGVVADVEHYPDFLPWCSALRIENRARDGDKEIVLAEMAVGFKALRERYTSRVVLNPEAHEISVTQTEGVFKYLKNDWRFTPEGAGNESCRVDFSIAFEFKSRLLGAIAGKAFAHVMTRMSQAFETRARQLAVKKHSKDA